VAGETITITGDVSPAIKRLDAFNLTARMVTLADVLGPRIRERIRREAPVGKGPEAGRLADSTRFTRRASVGDVLMEFTSDIPYAKFVIHGTRPHLIRPRAARVLHWEAPGGGDVFARSARHPGTKANDYPMRAYHSMRAEIISSFRALLERTT
jgi:hypothetical protein